MGYEKGSGYVENFVSWLLKVYVRATKLLNNKPKFHEVEKLVQICECTRVMQKTGS